jgi:hypothetical protein
MLTTNLLRQTLNVSGTNTHLGKVQFPSIHHIYNTHHLSRRLDRRQPKSFKLRHGIHQRRVFAMHPTPKLLKTLA